MSERYLAQNLIDNLHLRLFTARTLSIGGEWNTRDVQSTYWRFYRNSRDGAFLELADSVYALDAGRLYFVPAGVRFSCGNREPMSHFYIHFDVMGIQSLAMRELMSSPIALPHDEPLAEAVERAACSLTAGAPEDLATHCRLKAILYQAFAVHIGEIDTERLARSSRIAIEAEPVLPALRRIEGDLGSRLVNADLAAACCMSEDHFIKRFRECLGQTPARYILERRITTAAQRLLFTDSSIDRISDELGFGNRFYFTRVFTSRIGVPPAAYRKGY